MKKFLIGCGIVAVVLTALGIGAIAYTVHFVRRSVGDTKQLQTAQAQLRERFGTLESYDPGADWRLNNDRLERYLSVREQLGPRADRFAGELSNLIQRADAAKGDQKPRGFLEKMRFGMQMARGGLTLANAGVQVATVRDSLLLAAGMGDGEYLQLYCLTGFAWLGWDPMSDPGVRNLASAASGPQHRDLESLVTEFQSECREFFLKACESQMYALQSKSQRTAEEDALLQQLLGEVAKAKQDRGHFPLQGALTQAQIAVLAPFEPRARAALPQTSQRLVLDCVSVTKEVSFSNGRMHFEDRGPLGR